LSEFSWQFNLHALPFRRDDAGFTGDPDVLGADSDDSSSESGANIEPRVTVKPQSDLFRELDVEEPQSYRDETQAKVEEPLTNLDETRAKVEEPPINLDEPQANESDFASSLGSDTSVSS
jgi:hypothetical protein